MIFYLYKCDDFYDDENGMPVPCEKEFWADDENLITCPRCGHDSLKITDTKKFIEFKEEVASTKTRFSEYGLAGEKLIDEIKKAVSKYGADHVDLGIDVQENDCAAIVYYHSRHNSFDISEWIQTGLKYEQLQKICDICDIGYTEMERASK